MNRPRSIVILGLTLTSSWGNGHATTFRGLVRELSRRGHDVFFLERDTPWYASHRDVLQPAYGRHALYSSLAELFDRHTADVRDADLVIVGSYVPDGITVGEWVCRTSRGVTAFYDIDTPVTLAAVKRNACSYLSAALIRRYDLYLSFTGGPTLRRLERRWGAREARPLYCSFDPAEYFPERREPEWDLGYMGTFCPTRQPALERSLIEAARQLPDRRFVVAGPRYPAIAWPANVERVDNVPAPTHRAFYNGQRFTLNLTRADMIRAGYSPSVRLFEAAACAVPIITDYWDGLDTLFTPNVDLFVGDSAASIVRLLQEVPERERVAAGLRARARVLAGHTAEHRAVQLEGYMELALDARRPGRAAAVPAATVLRPVAT